MTTIVNLTPNAVIRIVVQAFDGGHSAGLPSSEVRVQEEGKWEHFEAEELI